MTNPVERMAWRISDAELERRWAAVRAAMEAADLDVLVMQNSNEFNGGYVRWFTDLAARHGNPMTVLFAREGGMVVVTAGDEGGCLVPKNDGSSPYRGVSKVLTGPYFTAQWSTDRVDAELAVSALKEMRHGRIGLLGAGAMRYSFGEHLVKELAGSTFTNASDLVDRIKAIKSDEEIARIRDSARLQDQVWQDVLDQVRPGVHEYELASYAYRQAQLLGSTDGLILTGSAPLGTAAVKGHRHFQHRVLQPGDQFTMLIEVNGPGGFYTELGRTCVLGKASRDLLDEFEIAVQAQAETARRLVPGAAPGEIWRAHNAYMRTRQRPEERRLFCHSQGYDLVERPALSEADDMPVASGMNIVVHPTYRTPTVYSWVCDNYLITDRGQERLHQTPQRIFELA